MRLCSCGESIMSEHSSGDPISPGSQDAVSQHNAAGELFAEHRSRLKRMVQLRLHPRLRRRIDESDVVQEALLDAARRLPEFEGSGASIFVWLRQITVHKLLDVHRRHLGAARRDVRREILRYGGLASATSASLAAQLQAGLTSPSSAAARKETQRLVQTALQSMDPIDREILVLRHFEQLSNGEAAQVLKIAESACSNRYVRALGRMKQILNQVSGFR